MTLYIILIISLFLSAFFSGMEIAFLSSSKLRFEVEKSESSLTSAIIEKFYKHPQQYITTMLVGNNIVLVVFSIKINEWLTPHLSGIENGLLLSLVVSLIATLIVLFIGEYIPKMLMRGNPNLWLRVFSPLLYVFYVLLYPIAWVSTQLARLFLRLFGVKIPAATEQLSFSRADLSYLVDDLKPTDTQSDKEELTHSLDGDEISENEMQIFRNALEFSKVKIRDCYVPRTEIVAMPYDSRVEDLIQTFRESGYSKIPIYKEDIDDIVGYLHCSEMFQHQDTWRDHINKMPFVPENMAAQKLMQTLMKQKKSMAVVVDEFGGTAGIISLEDIIEEIFGEIEDEHDTPEFTLRKSGDNEWLISGRMEVEEINRQTDLDLPEQEAYDTLAGLILHHTGTFPKLNEEFQIGNHKLKCVKSTSNRIELVKIIQ